ncbi:peptidase u35 : Marine sediment metagenome DNA, contig: S01H1_L03343 (Fragment) OS=marine sediment metagenome GN=S01H1_10112 PE=4 SV=1: HTH_17: Peptidase_U35 [Gemmata massiliana]|uniref:Uncharacterized protein n=1 Tax=Gemmata massiliana TaxID=1210884 RepID=A0A6P2CPF0_9BACT
MSIEPNAVNRMRAGKVSDTLDIREVADALKCHPITIRRLIKSGRFPRPIRVGNALRIRRDELKSWMDAGGSFGPRVECRAAVEGGSEKRYAGNAIAPTLRADGTGAGILTGYAAVFYDGTDGTEYELSTNTYERVSRSAFARDLSARADVVASFNHNVDLLLGRTASGTLRLSVDSRGLRYELDIPNTTLGRDVAELARRGDLRGSSFQFVTRTEKRYEDGGRTIRELTDVQLIELGPVWCPAYSGTSTGLSGSGHPSRASADADLIAVQLALMAMDESEEREETLSPRAREMVSLSAKCRRIASECDRARIASTLRLDGQRPPKSKDPQMICEFCGEDELDACFC